MLEELFLKLRGETRLFVRHVFADSVELPLSKLRLYGFKLKSKSDVVKVVDENFIKRLSITKALKGTKYIFTVITRNKINSFYYTEIYFFSYSKELCDVIKSELGNIVESLTGLEIANLLYRFLLIDIFSEFDTFEGKFKQNKKFFKNDFECKIRFKELICEVDWENTFCVVGGNFIGTDLTQYQKIFTLPWTGILYFVISLEDQIDNIKKKLAQAMIERKGLVDLKEKYETKEVELGGISLYFFTKDKERGYLVSLFSSCGFVPLEKNFGKKLFILGTPFLVRDVDFLFQVPFSELVYYFPISYSKIEIPENVLLYGKNRFGNFVGFNNFYECDNPHIMLFAPSGAGKSFFIQNCISQILRVDLEKIYEAKDFPKLKEDVLIRHFDKGFSAELFYKLLKHRGYDVNIVSPRMHEMAYNICEVDVEEDYEFSLGLVNSILSALEQKPLEDLERVYYLRALKTIYSRPKEYIGLNSISIEKLYYQYKDNEKFVEIYEKLRQKGYKDEDLIGDIKEKEFAFLQKATILDVIRFLSTSKELTLSTKEKEALDSTILKLEVISSYPIFTKPATFDFKHTKLFYFDYEFIYTHTFFVPIFLALLKKLIFVDKFYKKEEDLVLYIIDEAHNLFRREIFAELLTILIREARKYRIGLVFSTQNFVDIPASLIMNADTKMFLTPQEYSQKRAYLQELARHIQVDLDKEDLATVYYDMPMRQLTVWYKSGVFGLFMDVDKYKLMIFDSYRKKLPLPEGQTLYKSMVLEKDEDQ
ncbi:MAG: hypothetical protein QXM53_09745 [Thermofilaceae archaeon]